MQRPKVGEIAIGWRWLSTGQVRAILAGRKWGQKFGECARRKEHLTEFKVMTLLTRQRMIQPRLGEYFAKMGFLGQREIDEMARRQIARNASL